MDLESGETSSGFEEVKKYEKVELRHFSLFLSNNKYKWIKWFKLDNIFAIKTPKIRLEKSGNISIKR